MRRCWLNSTGSSGQQNSAEVLQQYTLVNLQVHAKEPGELCASGGMETAAPCEEEPRLRNASSPLLAFSLLA